MSGGGAGSLEYVPEAKEVADLLLGGLRGNVFNVDRSHFCDGRNAVAICVDIRVEVGIKGWVQVAMGSDEGVDVGRLL